MKTLTQFTEALQANKINVKDSINYLSVKQLNSYLDVNKGLLLPETIEIIQYLIDNNSSYISDLSTDNDENAIAGFYNTGNPKNKSLQPLWKNIDEVVKANRTLEIPVLQTEKQFNDIVDGNKSLDSVVYDMSKEDVRNMLAKKYNPLVIKICNQYHGKSNFSFDDLYSIALEAFTLAMNSYGKPKKGATDEEVKAIKKYSFGNWAAYVIRNFILDNIKNYSHTVKIPISQQQKEKKETGRNTKNYTVSGNKAVGHDDEGSKTLFDFIGGGDDPSSNLDREDVKTLWKEIYDLIIDKFGGDSMFCDIFFSMNELNGYKKMSNKELAAKYNIKPSNVTYYNSKVINYILHNKELISKFKDVYELMKECQADFDKNQLDNEPVYIKNNPNIAIEE